MKSFALFWWDFVVGDDWRVAAGVILAVVATDVLAAHSGVNAWWLPPVATAAVLCLAVWRSSRTRASD
jgi:hypothetical protein